MITPPTYTNKILTHDGYILAIGNVHPKYQHGPEASSQNITFNKIDGGYSGKTLQFVNIQKPFRHLQYWAENQVNPLYIILQKNISRQIEYCAKWTN